LQADALKRLSGGRTASLESVTLGAHPFVQRAGARWIVYDFSGRVLDLSTL
jgi:hypothetical protein